MSYFSTLKSQITFFLTPYRLPNLTTTHLHFSNCFSKCQCSNIPLDSEPQDAYIFQPSNFREHRRALHHTNLTKTSTSKSTSPSPSTTSSTNVSAYYQAERSDTNRRSSTNKRPKTTVKYKDHDSLIDDLQSLLSSSTNVPGTGPILTYRGSPGARLMVIGDMPGEDDDVDPFGKRAGILLNNIFSHCGFDIHSQLYVTNVVKRRTANGKAPRRSDIAFFMPYVKEEVRLISPSIIVLAGAVASRSFLGAEAKGKGGRITISAIRGTWFQLKVAQYEDEDEQNNDSPNNIWMIPVFHPAYLLRKQSMKKEMMDDINEIRRKYTQLFPDDPLISKPV